MDPSYVVCRICGCLVCVYEEAIAVHTMRLVFDVAPALVVFFSTSLHHQIRSFFAVLVCPVKDILTPDSCQVAGSTKSRPLDYMCFMSRFTSFPSRARTRRL